MTAGAGDLFLTSFKAIAQLLLQYAVGGVAAYAQIVKEEDMRGFSAVMNFILVPAISVASLGRGMSVALLKSDGWMLALIGFTAAYEYTFVALLLRRLANPSPEFRRLFVLMVCFPNVVAVPLAVTQALCELGSFDHEIESRDECVARSRALVFMYVTLDSFNIWVVMHAYISGDSGGNAAVAAEASTTRLELPGTELSSRATDGGADGAVGVATVVLADRPRPARWVMVARGARKQMAGVLRKPPVIALLVGLTIGLVRPLQAALFDDDGALHVVGLALVSLSDASVPMVNLMLAFSLGHKLRSLARWRDVFGSEAAGISPRVMLLSTVGRLVITPLVHGSLLYLALDYLPQGRLPRMILFIEMAPPTASMVIVLAHITRKPKAAQLAALAMLPQYLLATVTLTLIVAFALHVTSPAALPPAALLASPPPPLGPS